MIRKSWAPPFVTLLFATLASAVVGADEMPVGVQAGAPEEADRAAAIARKNTGGRVLDVRLMGDESPRSYAVRLLLDPGRVRTVVVDSDTEKLH